MRQIIFIVAMFIGLMMGHMIASFIFFGMITFAGFVFLVENITILKWIVYRTSALFDVLIFVASIVATIQLGVTITASLTVAGLAFTLLYRPWIINKMSKRK